MNNQLDFKVLNELYSKIAEITPKIILFILFVIIAWLLLKIVLIIVRGLLKITKIKRLEEKLNDNELVEKLNIKIKPDKIILAFVKWFLILVFIIIGAEFLGLKAISDETSNLISYLPQFFTALLIFIGGIYFANFIKVSVRNILKSFDINGSKTISLLVFYFLAIMVSITALNHAGVETELITNNLFLIIGAFLVAFAIAFGLGSKEVVYKLLIGFYSRKNIAVGDFIKIDEIEGMVLAIENISLKVKTVDNKTVIIPVANLGEKNVEILPK
ncbi:mechanosensitive ion channel domain-containing protein [Mesonia sp. K7]|uniref:mechanosensitive ion channel family protein n=1 Tax=Mesonia sp. K7 TaxID=2218606 RepID=UPI000DAA3999|nr:mechanosensitive ion channel domain-containing protein [Mesonia sp. K7]PZD78233.1 small-conductance mechanosensitive channel [Mesonia sp. K7]